LRWSIGGVLVSLAVIALTLLSTWAARGSDVFTDFATNMLLAVIGAALLAYVVMWAYRRLIKGRFLSLLFHSIQVLFGLLLAAGFLATAADVTGDVTSAIQAAPVAMPLILFPLAASAFYWMKAHTLAGRKIVDQIEGFRQYLGVAEEARLEALNPPDKTPELFERLLPYAVALDVENHWARRFAGVLAAAAASNVAPTWYSGSHSWSDPVGFANNLGADLSDTISSASKTPGSGGGGFSGGGGGGGGGGGW
jgi:uncharacterized membrane protein